MKKLVEKLVRGLFHPAEPSPLFIEALGRYAVPGKAQTPPIDAVLEARSPQALALFRRLPPGGAGRALVYALLRLSSAGPPPLEVLRQNLGRIALGLPTPELTLDSVPLYARSVVRYAKEAALRYERLRIAMASPRSRTHGFFLTAAAPVLDAYAKAAVSSERDFLVFHSRLFLFYDRLRRLCHINDLLTDRKYQSQTVISSPTSACLEETARHHQVFNILLGCDDIAYRVHNECIRSYLATGSFDDPYGEFFISSHSVDYGKVPPMVDHAVAEKVAYAGRYVRFLRTLHDDSLPSAIAEEIQALDIGKRSVGARIAKILSYINSELRGRFILAYRIPELLGFLRSVFILGRGDFGDFLFSALQDTKSGAGGKKRSLLPILEAALDDSFPGSPFASVVDIFVKENASGKGEALDSLDTFALYCRPVHPTTILLEEHLVLKLVYIFRFLWKLRRVDTLAKRVRAIEYTNLTSRLSFYVFHEAAAIFRPDALLAAWDPAGPALDTLRANLDRQLDSAMQRLFINTQAKRIEYLLFHMEAAFVQAGKTGALDDTAVQIALKDFCDCAGTALEGTYIENMREFVRD